MPKKKVFTPEEVGLGRRRVADGNDKNFLIAAMAPLQEEITITRKYHNDMGAWLNQGRTSSCVGHAWAHCLEDGPITQAGSKIAVDPYQIYREAQLRDEWPGTEPAYFGTSIRAGAKYLQELGYIKEYRWAWDMETLIRALLTVGPAVIGVNWYSSMFNPEPGGLIKVNGWVEGGHAVVINGVNTKTRLFRGKNSWGKNWGSKGRFYIGFDDMERLMHEGSEICLPVEIKIPY